MESAIRSEGLSLVPPAMIERFALQLTQLTKLGETAEEAISRMLPELRAVIVQQSGGRLSNQGVEVGALLAVGQAQKRAISILKEMIDKHSAP